MTLSSPRIYILAAIIFLVDDEKYKICSSKIEITTKMEIHKMNERIDSGIILEVTDDEGEIYLLINIKCTVTVEEPVSPI